MPVATSSESNEGHRRAVYGDKVPPLFVINLILENVAYMDSTNELFITEPQK